jgi:conjugal transfer mating pair stabilization protein TraN
MNSCKWLVVSSKLGLFLLLFLCFIQNSFTQETCTLTGETCVEAGGTRNVGGKDVYKPCWRYQKTYHCYEPEIDYCQPLKDLGCEQLNSTCTATDILDGKCNNYQNTYRCGSLLAGEPDPNITLLSSTYNITKDELDYSKCDGRDALPNCLIVDSICKQPSETRNINGKDVYKSCWQFENTYSCNIGGSVNSCVNIPDYCQYSSSQCLSQTGSLCVHTQKTYLCSQSTPIPPEQMQCGANVYCLNGQCEKVEDSSPNDFAKSIGYLAAINESKDNNGDPGNLRIFTGNAKGCVIKAGGYNNCCKDQGWGQSVGGSCSPEETSLADLQAKKQCHYVGSYCSDEQPFGICLETRKTSCCFNSKISRVIIEQGRAQLGIGWGSAEAPNCGGFTPEQLQSLKFDQMDLSEISVDITNSAVVPDSTYLEEKAREAMKKYEKN